MDFIESLAKQASQITMYDVKSYYNQAKNAVMNIPEMEAKVREATNEDPCQHFNEIMPTIYSRFMEKEAREWRQIYKALTLLEYLIKHGSERVVDDARAHVSTIKMLRNFHYVDEKGKDQGINVRNRAQEIASLLGDVERIRAERRKAKANRNKYQGTGNDGLTFQSASGSRYGGFGSESVGGASAGGSRGYDGEEYRGSRSSYRESSRAEPEYDEYEGADDFDDRPPRRSGASTAPTSAPSTASRPAAASPPAPKPVAKEPAKEVNLFDFDDEPAPAPAAAPSAAAAPADVMGDDDFDDFQQAPSATTTAAAPAPAAAAKPAAAGNANLFALLDAAKPSVPAMSPTLTPPRPSYASTPSQGYGAGSPAMMSPPLSAGTSTMSAAAPKPAAAKSTFDDLWTTSLSSVGGAKGGGGTSAPIASNGVGGKTIAQMEQEKAMSKLWGAPVQSPASSAAAAKPAQSAAGLDDLLF